MSKEKRVFNAVAGQSMSVAKISPEGINEFRKLLEGARYYDSKELEKFLRSNMAMPFLQGLMGSGSMGRNFVAECLSYPAAVKILVNTDKLNIPTLVDWMENFNTQQQTKILLTKAIMEIREYWDANYQGEGGLYHDTLLKWMENFDLHQKTLILSHPHGFLTFSSELGLEDKVLEWMSAMDQSQRAAILISDRTSLSSGNVDIWLPWMTALTPDQRIDALSSSSYIVSDLCRAKRADIVVEWIDPLDNDLIAAILSTEDNINPLCENGGSKKIVDWIDRLDSDQRTVVLTNRNIEELIEYLPLDLKRWINDLDEKQRKLVLSSANIFEYPPSIDYYASQIGTEQLGAWAREVRGESFSNYSKWFQDRKQDSNSPAP